MKKIICVLFGLGLCLGPAFGQEFAVDKRIQELVRSVEELKAFALPAGSVFFVQTKECPKPFIEFVASRGRAIVGAPEPGVVGAPVGPSMTDQEPRNRVPYHQHSFVVPGHEHTVPVQGLASYDPAPSQIAGGHGLLLSDTMVHLSERGPKPLYDVQWRTRRASAPVYSA